MRTLKLLSAITLLCSVNQVESQNTFPSSGNAGIGTTSPGAYLDIRTNSGQKGLILGLKSSPGGGNGPWLIFDALNAGSSNGIFGMKQSGSSFYFQSYDSHSWGGKVNLMTITKTGNVGIGTTSPGHKLDVNGTIRAIDFTTAGGQNIVVGDDAFLSDIDIPNTIGIYGLQSPAQGGIQLGNYSGALIYGEFGRIGIGNTDPAYKLDVAGALNLNKGVTEGIALNVNGKEAVWFNGDHFNWGSGGTWNAFEDKVSIGTLNFPGSYMLAVNGNIRAKEIVVETGWSDFVFKNDYKLRTLTEVESFIKENGHLPEIPSAKEVEENGVTVGEMESKLLMKIEELTLYLIEMKKQNEELSRRIVSLEQIKE